MKKTRHTFTHLSVQLILVILAIVLSGVGGFAQETRSTLLGTVRDPSGAVVSGATVIITNSETNVVTQVTSNNSGYFEATYLLPGSYTLTATAQGFKKSIQQGITLSVNTRINIDITLEVGDTSDQVTITATAPLLETTTASGSASLDTRQIMDLPVFGNSAILLTRSVPGIQWTGQPNYLGLHSVSGGSTVKAAGDVGGTEYALDGVPNLGSGRQVGYLPYTDTVAEVKVESAPFDASKGHTSGATISMLTKSGTNNYHGTLTWQHWQQRWNATQSTTNAAYWGPIKEAEARGDTATAQRLRSNQRQPSGRSNNWAAVIGGPVRIPKLYNGRDKLFFFFSYNAFKDVKSEEGTAVNHTVPTEGQRRGDFSELLKVDPIRYQIYDPRAARMEGNRIVRSPFPNNQVPILNPLYNAYLKLYPLPNNVPGVVGADGSNNWLASATPFNWDYKAFSNRIDYHISPRHRMFGKWSWNDFLEDRHDWTYPTARGLQSNGQSRLNIGITVDYVFIMNPTTTWNFSVAWNRFRSGDTVNEVQKSFSPGSVGLPGYVDEKAGDFKLLPRLDFSDSSYEDISRGYPDFTRYSVGTIRGDLTKLLGTHSIRTGVDLRQNWRAFGAPGDSSGVFQFRNDYVRQRDDTNNAGTLGLEWAAFMLGVPTGVSIATNDTGYLTNPYYGGYVQDDWRVNSKLTLNLGLRYELEGGFRERFNRGIGEFDPNPVLPITDLAKVAYARNPIPELPVSQFDVRGGSLYLGKDGAPRTVNAAKGGLMPRLGVAYQINSKTVLRAGYGLFYDTVNVLIDGLDQFGFSRSTGTILTNNRGLTFLNTNLTSPECRANASNCRTIFSDPFPVRQDGTRFNVPLGNQLGLMSVAGRGFDYEGRDWERARQHRWRVGIQRELTNNMVFEIAYLGSYADNISMTKRLNPLPEQYWATGLVRNDAVANFLNATFPNPFLVTNFDTIRTQNPTLYNDLANTGFFNTTTIRRHQLLRQFPHMTSGDGVRNTRVAAGEAKYHHLELSVQKRMSRGLSYMVAYTWSNDLDRNFYENEFSEKPVWRPGSGSRPHHFMFNAIYELPFGKGKPFLSDKSILSAIFGGWQISAIYHYQSGRTYDFGNVFWYGSDLRSIKLDNPTPDRWFDTSQFERASAKQPAAFHRRVFPSRLNWLRGDIMNQLDANIIRGINLTERVNLQFRVDFINALNSVQWDNPETSPTNANFGRATEQWNTPRWIQFQMRLKF